MWTSVEKSYGVGLRDWSVQSSPSSASSSNILSFWAVGYPSNYRAGGLKPGCRLILGFPEAKCTVVGWPGPKSTYYGGQVAAAESCGRRESGAASSTRTRRRLSYT